MRAITIEFDKTGLTQDLIELIKKFFFIIKVDYFVNLHLILRQIIKINIHV